MPGEITEKESCGGLKNGCFRKDIHTICTYDNETAMLKAFVAYISARDPDVLSGWNFVEFDMPYITGRMERLGLRSDTLARIPGQTERNALRGRALFDLLTAYKKMHATLKRVIPSRCGCTGGGRGDKGPVYRDDLGPLEKDTGAACRI